MEKPMATSMDEAAHIMAEIRANKSTACIAHNYLYRHAPIQAIKLIEEVIKTAEKGDDDIIHKGISQRSFSRSFTIADDVKVNVAELKDGLLTINCEKIVPEQKKKKLIPIK